MTRTVQEPEAIVEILVDKVKHLYKILENVLETKIRHLEVKERDTEHQIDMLNKKIEKTSDVNCFVEVKCKDCDKVCESKKSLRQHLMKNHPRSFSCAKCGKCFEARFKMEEHLREHDNAEKFKCRLCESEFYTEWRLKKHIEGHQKVNRKFCHYYNNGKKCPFAEIGCKFKHEISYECFHGKGFLCANTDTKHKQILEKSRKILLIIK